MRGGDRRQEEETRLRREEETGQSRREEETRLGREEEETLISEVSLPVVFLRCSSSSSVSSPPGGSLQTEAKSRRHESYNKGVKETSRTVKESRRHESYREGVKETRVVS